MVGWLFAVSSGLLRVRWGQDMYVGLGLGSREPGGGEVDDSDHFVLFR